MQSPRHALRAASLLFILALLLSWAVPSQPDSGPIERITARGYLLWGSDAEGGAPYAFPDPKDPSRLVGFEVDIAEAIARELGVALRQSQNAWDSLIPALERGDFDLAMNGIEITPQREGRVIFSMPYYVYTEQLVVRKGETGIKGMDNLKGKKVGTLSGAVAQDILMQIPGVDLKVYPGQVEPYEDLALGRLDAVLLDLPIAAYYGKPNPNLTYAGPPVGEGFYGIAFRKQDGELKKRVDEILLKLLKSGELRRIYEKWDMWNSCTTTTSGHVTASRVRMGLSSLRQNAITGAPIRSDPKLGKAWAYFPLLKAAKASSSAAVTTPCPPRRWKRTCHIDLPFISQPAHWPCVYHRHVRTG